MRIFNLEISSLVDHVNKASNPGYKLLLYNALLDGFRTINQMVDELVEQTRNRGLNGTLMLNRSGNPRNKHLGDCLANFARVDTQRLQAPKTSHGRLGMHPGQKKWKSIYTLGKRLSHSG